eukprot:m.208761 g.208761  ORF g.208761 m.208761 type:complete len:116 (-) comp10132_c1_seq29:385-732(-)
MNLVFGYSDSRSAIIDFDFAQFVGPSAGSFTYPEYPECYQHNLPDVERHADAEAGVPMKLAHDVYALHSVYSRFQCLTDSADKSWTQALRALKRSGLQVFIDCCNDLDATLIPRL